MRRLVLFLCAVTAMASLVVGSGGFTSAATDRGVTVDVVGDGDAYMALDYSNDTAEATVGETAALDVVTVRNQFTEAVDVTVNYTVSGADGVSTDDGSESAPLGVGEETDVSTAVTCDDPGEYTVTVAFDVTADGSGVLAGTSDERTVRYDVRCVPT